jgi:ABC-type transport system involved in multi-copper enzyme maturation permease subunit
LLVVSLVTTLLVASQANRMSSTVVVVRLPRRSELLGAIVTSALVVAVAMAVLFTGLVLGQAKVAMTAVHLAVIAPRWLALTALFAVIGLHLSRLISRGGSHLFALGLLAFVATVIEREGVLLRSSLAGLARAVLAVSDPVMAALREPAVPASLASYASNLLLLVVYALGLFALAVWLFRRKDLLWAD